MSFKECCEQAEIKLKGSNNQPTEDRAMCFLTTALVYSVLAVACAIKENKKEE